MMPFSMGRHARALLACFPDIVVIVSRTPLFAGYGHLPLLDPKINGGMIA